MNGAPTAAATPKRFVWYDLETTGVHPPSDHIMQFAAQATDAQLKPVGKPCTGFVRLAADTLPSAEACLVTGLTPQKVAKGVDEWEAMRRLDALIGEPGTCVVGYNNLRFDDEFLRFARYRSLMDPYVREWRDGNTRWDLIDLARAACALRPEGVRWPHAEDGAPGFQLERLCEANGIANPNPHDALTDVDSTIAFARLLRAAQPKLWRFALAGRLRNAAAAHLLPLGRKLCVHVSGRYPNARRCIAPVAAVAMHPSIRGRVVVADLSQDIEMLLDCDADELAERLYAPREGDDEVERPPLKEVVMNRSPFVAPIAVVRAEDAARLGFDLDAIERRRKALADVPDLARKIAAVYDRPAPASGGAASQDAELALYDGFASDADRRVMDKLQAALASGEPWPDFRPRDERLRVLGARLKARLRPSELNAAERAQWQAHARRCLEHGFGKRPSLAAYRQEIAKLQADERTAERREVLEALAAYEPTP